MKSNDTINNYLRNIYLRESFDIIHEGVVKDIVDKLNPGIVKSTLSKIKDSVKNKDISGIKRVVNSLSIPTVPLNSLEDMWNKTSPGFSKAYKIAKSSTSKLFPGVPKQTAEVGALLVAGISSIKSKDPEGDTINNLQRLSSMLKMKNESEEILKESEMVGLFIIGIVGMVILTLAAPGIMGSLGATGILIFTGLVLASLKLFLG